MRHFLTPFRSPKPCMMSISAPMAPHRVRRPENTAYTLFIVKMNYWIDRIDPVTGRRTTLTTTGGGRGAGSDHPAAHARRSERPRASRPSGRSGA